MNLKSEMTIPVSSDLKFSKGEYKIPHIKEVNEDSPISMRKNQKFANKNSTIDKTLKNSKRTFTLNPNHVEDKK